MIIYVMKDNLIIAKNFYLEELIDALFQKNKFDILIDIIWLIHHTNDLLPYEESKYVKLKQVREKSPTDYYLPFTIILKCIGIS